MKTAFGALTFRSNNVLHPNTDNCPTKSISETNGDNFPPINAQRGVACWGVVTQIHVSGIVNV